METNDILNRFVSNGARISDRFPDVSSDGYVGHCKTEEEAKAECVRRNLQWAAEVVRMKKEENREWTRTPYRPGHYFFALILPKVESYID